MSTITELKTATTALADTVYLLTEVWGHENLTTVDTATGYYFADTEKTLDADADDNSCWIAAAVNGMQWGGWVSTGDASITTEDKFFDYCVSCWGENDGGYSEALFSWWLSGKTGIYGFATTSGGGKFSSVDPTDYYTSVNMVGSSSINNLIAYLEAGYFVSLGIKATGVSHAISCWGYEVVDGNIYLYYSDSDDGEVSGSDRTQASNELCKTVLTYNRMTMRYYMSDYFYPGIYISDFTAIAQYDSIMSGVHETLDDAREIVADPEDEVIRRGRLDGAGDDDYYKLTGTGRGASFTVYTLSESSPVITITMYDSEGNYDSAVEDTTGCIGTYTTAAGEYYYLKIVGNASGSSSLSTNLYQIVVTAGKWWVGWNALADTASEQVNILDEVKDVYIAEDDGFLVSSGTASAHYAAALVGNDDPYRIIYGGASSGTVAGDIRLGLDETTVYYLYGGGASGSEVDGSIYLQLDNETTVKSVLIAGGESDVTGGVYLNVVSGGGTGNYYGGASNAAVAGSVISVYSDGSFTGLIYGGSRATGDSASSGDVNLTIDGELSQTNNLKMLAKGSTAWLVGGGQSISGGALTAGDVTISISGKAALNNIVGGAHAEGTSAVATVDSVTISVADCTVNGNIYGGGYVNNGGVSTVSGGVSISVDTTDAIASIYGNIYVGGANPLRSSSSTALVYGGASITFSGLGDNLNFSGTVSGDGVVSGTVSGGSSLIFSNFYGDFTGQIRNFGVLEVADSMVTLTKSVTVDTALFKLTEELTGTMLTASELHFDSMVVELSAALCSDANSEFTLFSAANAMSLDEAIAVSFYDSSDNYLGSVDLGGGSLSFSNGSLSLSWDGNSLMLQLTA